MAIVGSVGVEMPADLARRLRGCHRTIREGAEEGRDRIDQRVSDAPELLRPHGEWRGAQ
jgi:hypothetical protein